MSQRIDRQVFWNQKIIKWENSKYRSPAGGASRLFDVNRSVKKRLAIAESLLKQTAKDRVVLELGCGSAKLMPAALESGAKKYIGIDLSDIAIDEAKKTADKLGLTNRVELYQGNVSDLQSFQVDVCFSLGLVDWLNWDELQQLAKQIKTRYFFHSFSEKKISVQQYLHRLYVYMLYGHRTNRYVPQYHAFKDLASVFATSSHQKVQYFHHPDLSFGAFLYILPEGIRF